MADPYQILLLSPGETIFYRNKGGMLAMRSSGTEYPEVYLRRTFPFSEPNSTLLSVRNPEGEEIGILEHITELDDASILQVELELKLSYMTPRVTRIEKIKHKGGIWIWELQTTKGPIKLVMNNLHENVQNPVPGRLLLSDSEGNRVEIINYRELDEHSRKQINSIL